MSEEKHAFVPADLDNLVAAYNEGCIAFTFYLSGFGDVPESLGGEADAMTASRYSLP